MLAWSHWARLLAEAEVWIVSVTNRHRTFRACRLVRAPVFPLEIVSISQQSLFSRLKLRTVLSRQGQTSWISRATESRVVLNTTLWTKQYLRPKLILTRTSLLRAWSRHRRRRSTRVWHQTTKCLMVQWSSIESMARLTTAWTRSLSQPTCPK